MRLQHEESEEVEVQMAPMIDCVFLLLIFFLVASTLGKLHNEVPVQLIEQGVLSTAPAENALYTIHVTEQGRIRIGQQELSLDALRTHLAQVAEQNSRRRIEIVGQPNTAFQYIVYVLDACQLAGLHNVGFNTPQ